MFHNPTRHNMKDILIKPHLTQKVWPQRGLTLGNDMFPSCENGICVKLPYIQTPNLNHGRTMGDYLQPETVTTPSCITFPYNGGHFNFRPGMLPHLPLFYGRDNEDPYPHIGEFESICHTFEDQRCTPEFIRLKHFSFSLKDRAKDWLLNLVPNSVGTWQELQRQFYKEIFLIHRSQALVKQIQNFSQGNEETFTNY